MDVTEAMERARDRWGRHQVFGEPVTQDGTIVLPVVRVGGRAGGGAGPAGVYAIREGKVSWQPAVDVDRVILGGQLLGALALVVLHAVVRSRAAVRVAATPARPADAGTPPPTPA